MRDTLSKPVRMPSYKPGLFVYRQLREQNRSLVRLGFSHYSNGQSGPQLNADGTTNIRDGEFTSNFVDVAFVSIRDPKGAADAITVEAQRFFSQDDYSAVVLGQTRIAGSYQIQVRPEDANSLIVRWEVSAWPESQKFAGARSITNDVMIGWAPSKLDDAGLFLRHVWGVDSYNLWFDRGRQRYLQIGLMAWPFKRSL